MAYQTLICVFGRDEPIHEGTYKTEEEALQRATLILQQGLQIIELAEGSPPIKTLIPTHRLAQAEVHDDRPGLITPNKGLVDPEGRPL